MCTDFFLLSLCCALSAVIPAKAGIHPSAREMSEYGSKGCRKTGKEIQEVWRVTLTISRFTHVSGWVPAFAGTTEGCAGMMVYLIFYDVSVSI